MATQTADEREDIAMGGTSPKTKTALEHTIERSLDAMGSGFETRADPDAQTTVMDFLDFTEYLPSDIVRSLTLIGKLDEQYISASTKVHELTTTWGQLPTMSSDKRPVPAKLRADISEQLKQSVDSRVFAHSEAVRMSDNIQRHYQKAKVLLSKLQSMMDNYPAEEAKSPVSTRSPQMSRSKAAAQAGGDGGRKTRQKRVPRITVPGEVLAPYDIEYDFSDDSDVSTDPESEVSHAVRRTPATVPRIKLVTNKTPKSASRPRATPINSVALSAAAAANAAALLNPPPENAVIGSADAPWLQLTQYELAKLRKRMKKNATWTPSETMIARELKTLCRGPDAYREAKRKAEEEGKPFDPKIPAPVMNSVSGAPELPAGAISVDSLAVEDVPTSNRGMKLNEAKKLKREAMARLAAEEAGEVPRDTKEAKHSLARPASTAGDSPKKDKPRPNNSRSNNKRKRGGEDQAADPQEKTETPTRPAPKRNRTETPVLPPQRPSASVTSSAETSQVNLRPSSTRANTTPTQTPVPIPKLPRQNANTPVPASSAAHTITTAVPTKAPAQTPVPLPPNVASMSNSGSAPPSSGKRQTRAELAKQVQQQADTPTAPSEAPSRRSSSRTATPRTTPAPERRPASRAGKAASQEPQPTLAADRPRRASTARNTPAPESKPPVKRTKRPAPGIVSTTSSGGNSAVGKRKAAPRRKARTTKRGKDQTAETEMEEVDDEGNPIDPDEPRYCKCNRVSFGVMIQCDNTDVSFPDPRTCPYSTNAKRTELQTGVVPPGMCRTPRHPGEDHQVVLPGLPGAAQHWGERGSECARGAEVRSGRALAMTVGIPYRGSRSFGVWEDGAVIWLERKDRSSCMFDYLYLP